MSARIPEGEIRRLKRAIDLGQIVGARVELKKRGADFYACCPFHNERTASFTVIPAGQYAHCFGCGWNGDAIAFVQDYEHVTFAQAIEVLCRETGFVLKSPEPQGPRRGRDANETVRSHYDWIQSRHRDERQSKLAGIEARLIPHLYVLQWCFAGDAEPGDVPGDALDVDPIQPALKPPTTARITTAVTTVRTALHTCYSDLRCDDPMTDRSLCDHAQVLVDVYTQRLVARTQGQALRHKAPWYKPYPYEPYPKHLWEAEIESAQVLARALKGIRLRS